MKTVFKVLGMAIVLAGISAHAKYNVCTITLNSTDEIELFKKYLPENDFDFTELVPPEPLELGSDPEQWFKKAVASGISCDSIIASAHFGGKFFGMQTNYYLSLETLEKQSCLPNSDALLKHPKEIFLFGCNTLAGKAPDDRSPEHLRAALISDGFSTEEAEQVVSFRYSPIGEKFGDRMRRIFSNVRYIYGFDSRAPLGPVIAPHIRNYLKQSSANYKSIFESDVVQKHSALLTSVNRLPGKKMIQETGWKLEAGEVLPVCYLNDEKISITQKMVWIENAIASERRLEFISYIRDFFEDHKDHKWNSKERQILQNIRSNETARLEVLKLREIPIEAILGVQVKLMEFSKQIGWLDQEELFLILRTLIIGDLKKKFSTTKMDAVCSLNMAKPLALSTEHIPVAGWSDANFITSLGCLKPTDLGIQRKLLELTQNGLKDIRTQAAIALSKIPNVSVETMDALSSILATDSSTASEIRIAILKSVARYPTPNENLKEIIFRTFVTDMDADVVSAATDTMFAINVQPNPEVVQKLQEIALGSTESFRRRYAVRTLKKLSHPERYMEVFSRALKDPDFNVQIEGIYAYGLILPADSDFALALVETLRSSKNDRITLASYSTLAVLPLTGQPEQEALISIVKRQNVEENSDRKALYAVQSLTRKKLRPEIIEALRNQVDIETDTKVRHKIELAIKSAN